jgi:hypothetical protein
MEEIDNFIDKYNNSKQKELELTDIYLNESSKNLFNSNFYRGFKLNFSKLINKDYMYLGYGMYYNEINS